jgi:hypothetical protein
MENQGANGSAESTNQAKQFRVLDHEQQQTKQISSINEIRFVYLNPQFPAKQLKTGEMLFRKRLLLRF